MAFDFSGKLHSLLAVKVSEIKTTQRLNNLIRL
jgi:hypothetical protein